ncbi:hypothetical protein C7H19_18400 [Aphanothece hegewaldii CCALA 016]|uniref:Uncharacterized protein n=1 Tax=Aphanothece hegewaldii CCALA 016 TaxID=2107694 RepID=A0A2T1LTU1_9CHRO|nr:hypothetical protein [Aphanothece hegewaldii]PSF34538.1 hypothetical protein C7H19_18400 [Aphanothece hegewaldii CCALA 016]
MKDFLTGLDNHIYQQYDLSNNWKKAINLGNALTGKQFSVNGFLGGTNQREVYDSVDRLKFNLKKSLHLEINTDPKVITELVKFENGQAFVVDSIEYGSQLSLNLSPGHYGLSFFVEGDLISYHVNAQFSSIL